MIEEGIRGIEARIAAAIQRSGRAEGDVRLMAVSKTFPPEAVEEAIRAGQTLFGENRVQEAAAKIPQCSSSAEWHLIGHLQGNKVKHAVRLFSAIHSVDSVKLYEELARAADEAGTRPRVLVEVNIGADGAKFGVRPDDAERALREMNAVGGLEIAGLMTVPPFNPDPEASRAHFRNLRELAQKLRDLTGLALPELSMGMSNDFEVAVEEGSTIVRLGRAIFGERVSQRRQMDADSDTYIYQ